MLALKLCVSLIFIQMDISQQVKTQYAKIGIFGPAFIHNKHVSGKLFTKHAIALARENTINRTEPSPHVL